MNVLFLCTGNTCRSPMAKAVFDKLVSERGLEGQFACLSAGFAASPGEPANSKAVEAAGEEGLDLTGHRAGQVTSQMLLDAGLIAVMTEEHRMLLERAFPQLSHKIRVGGIPDPFGGTLEDYRACLGSLIRWESALLDELTQEKGKQYPSGCRSSCERSDR